MHRDECTVCRHGGDRGSLKCISESEVGRRRQLGQAWWTSPRRFSSATKTGSDQKCSAPGATFTSDSSQGAAINGGVPLHPASGLLSAATHLSVTFSSVLHAVHREILGSRSHVV